MKHVHAHLQATSLDSTVLHLHVHFHVHVYVHFHVHVYCGNAPFSGNIRLIKNLETENLLTVARLMVKSAIMRKESRGSHCRLDYQNIDNESWNKSILSKLKNSFGS